MILDMRTTLALTVVYSLFIGASIIMFAPYRKHTRGILLIGSGVLTYGIGFLCLSLRDYIGTFLSVIVANALVIIGLMCILQGLTNFRTIHTNWLYQNICLTCLLIGSFFYFTYKSPNVNVRIIIISAIISLLLGEIAYVFLKYPERLIRRQIFIIGGFFVLATALNLLRIYLTLYEPPMGSFMSAGFIHVLSTTVFQVMPYILSIGTFWISNAWIEEELVKETKTDGLTGLYNRMAIMDIAEREFARSKKHNSTIGIAMCDLDHFKVINDRHGHQVGDEVLKSVTRSLNDNLRIEDFIGRYGGEEFLLIIPGITQDRLEGLLESLRRLIESTEVPTLKGPLKTSVCFGGFVATNSYTLTEAISNADNALYEAKTNGRNMVCMGK